MTYWDSIEDPTKRKLADNRPPVVDPYQLVPKKGSGSVTSVGLDDSRPPPAGEPMENTAEVMGDETTPTTAIDAVDDEGEYLTTQDDLAEDFNRSYLEPGAADTTDEEAYINQRISDQLGAQQVASRAKMGRAGFGSSGALATMEGDQMRQANLDAEGEIYDVREREQNQTFDQGVGVQEMDIRQQEAAARLEQEKAQAAAIEALLGGGADPADTDGDGIISNEEADEQARSDELESNQDFGESVGINAEHNNPPPDADTYNEWPNAGEPIGFPTGQDDEWLYAVGLDGKHWKVRR